MKPGFFRTRHLCWWTVACCWLTASAAWGWGLQVHVRPPTPRAGPVRIPAEWVREGFPSEVDVSRPIAEPELWMKFKRGIIERGSSNRLVLPRDFDMVRFLFTQVPGRSDSFNNFVCLPKYFVGTAYEKPAIALLRPIIRSAGLDPATYAITALSLARLNDRESIFRMLAMLPGMEGSSAFVMRMAVRQLGWVLPSEEARSTPD